MCTSPLRARAVRILLCIVPSCGGKKIYNKCFRSGNYSKSCVAALTTPQNAVSALATRDASDCKGELTVLEALRRMVPEDANCLSVDDMNTALILPWPFVHLIARGRWQWIAMPSAGRWPQCTALRIVTLWRRFEIADNEPNNLINDEDGNALEAEAGALFQPRVFQQIADYLRDRVGVLETSAIDPETERDRVEMYVHWLERCVAGVSEEAAEGTMYEGMTSRGGKYFKHLGRHARYFSEFFVKVIFFTMDIRNDDFEDGSFVGKTFKKAIRLLPPQVRNMLEEMYKDQVFPSPATMSRASLFLDVAFMRLMADVHERLVSANSIFFGLTDASPIGGRLYQITEFFVFGGDDPGGKLLLEAGAATVRLRSFSKHAEEITLEDLMAMERCMDIIRLAKHLHCFAPPCVWTRAIPLVLSDPTVSCNKPAWRVILGTTPRSYWPCSSLLLSIEDPRLV